MPLDPTLTLDPLDLQDAGAVLGRGEVERRLGRPLPDGLVGLLTPSGGPLSFTAEVVIDLPPHGPAREDIRGVFAFFGLNAGRDGILAEHDRLLGRTHREIVPFAGDGLGNVFGFVERSEEVVFWHHESPAGEVHPSALTPVADDFEAFLSKLRVEPERGGEGGSRAVSSWFNF